MSDNNTIPSPEEWLKKQVSPHMRKCMKQGLEPILSHQDVLSAMQEYAAHVAALVHRNTRHLSAEIVDTEGGGNGEQCAQSNARMYNSIKNIPLRTVYPAPAGEENREG